jgi:dihydrofolate reductase
MKIILVAAMASNRVIGHQGKMPWQGQFPEDMQHFRRLTTGHAVIMGRKTYVSIGKALPNRHNVVVSRAGSDRFMIDCDVRDSLEAAINHCRVLRHKNCFIIGGGEIYRQALDFADEIVLSTIHKEFEGDTFFPKIDLAKFEFVQSDEASNEHFSYSFEYWERTSRA